MPKKCSQVINSLNWKVLMICWRKEQFLDPYYRPRELNFLRSIEPDIKVLYTKAAKRQENVGKLVSYRTFSTEILGVKSKSCRDMRVNLGHIVTVCHVKVK